MKSSSQPEVKELGYDLLEGALSHCENKIRSAIYILGA